MIKKNKLFGKICSFILCGFLAFTSTGYVLPEAEAYAASNLKINKSKASMYVGDTLNLSLEGAGSGVVWASSKSAVATVSSAGKVTAVKAGTATVTAIYKGNSYTCKVSVNEPGPAKSKVTLDVGQTYTIKMNGVTAKSYSSSKKSVATVSSKGKVTAKKAGTAKITVTCTNGKKYTCTVKVKAGEELSSKDIYAKCCKSVVEVNAGVSLGSGFFIAKNTVVTNYHVINGATELSIKLLDESEYDVTKVLGFDESIDLAVLEVECKGTPIAKNTHGVTMGEKTYTIGSSLGLTNTFSDGMVSNPKREMDGVKYIQTNTAISHGNSGGPLINAYGEVIGVTTSSFTEGQNLNLAINISELDRISLKKEMTAKQFINRFNGRNSDGTDVPELTAYLDYDYGDGNILYLRLSNDGSKSLTLGSGDFTTSVLLVYPNDGYLYANEYVEANWYNDKTKKLLSGVECYPGESGYVAIKTTQKVFLASGASIAFTFYYDGHMYIGTVDEYGHVDSWIPNF